MTWWNKINSQKSTGVWKEGEEKVHEFGLGKRSRDYTFIFTNFYKFNISQLQIQAAKHSSISIICAVDSIRNYRFLYHFIVDASILKYHLHVSLLLSYVSY